MIRLAPGKSQADTLRREFPPALRARPDFGRTAVRSRRSLSTVAFMVRPMFAPLPPIPSNCYGTRAAAFLSILIAVPIFFLYDAVAHPNQPLTMVGSTTPSCRARGSVAGEFHQLCQLKVNARNRPSLLQSFCSHSGESSPSTSSVFGRPYLQNAR